MRYDALTAQTYDRLAAVKALLDVLDHALPTSEARENEALRELADAGDWPPEEFESEVQNLDMRFRHWLPRYAAYSVIILLDAVVESQLLACARRAGLDTKSQFEPRDLRGGGIDAAKLYMNRLGVIDVGKAAEWTVIRDLRDLRNLIVHRVGAKGSSSEHRKTAERLELKYRGQLEFPDQDFNMSDEVWVSMHLCRSWVNTVSSFFNRVLRAIGLPKLAPGLKTDDAG